MEAAATLPEGGNGVWLVGMGAAVLPEGGVWV